MKQKNVWLLLVILLFGISGLSAQEKKPEEKLRPTYIHFSYSTQTLKKEGREAFSIPSDFGAALTAGRTYYLHKKPLLNMIRFGIDWSFIDLNFAGNTRQVEEMYGLGYVPNYDDDDEYKEDDKWRTYQLELAMQAGPSVTLNPPVRGLQVQAYFRYAPSLTAIASDITDNVSAGYGSFFVAGAGISYKILSVGIESRWGSGKYKFTFEEEDSYGWYEYSEKQKMKTSGTRFYIGLRF